MKNQDWKDCDCLACRDGANESAMKFASEEVLPFLKKELLRLRFASHPIPSSYGNLTWSAFAYAQVAFYLKFHPEENGVYYTENTYLIKFSKELGDKFRLPVRHASEAPQNVLDACEYNCQKPI